MTEHDDTVTLTRSQSAGILAFAAGAIIVATFGGMAIGNTWGAAQGDRVIADQARALSTVDPIRTDGVIPACIHDDYNDGTQTLCYTVTTDGQVVVIDERDEVVS